MPVAEQPCTHRQVSQIFVVRNVSGVHHLSCVVGNSKFLIDVCSVHGLDEYIYYVSVYSISNLLKLSEPNSMLTLVITGTCSSVSRVKKPKNMSQWKKVLLDCCYNQRYVPSSSLSLRMGTSDHILAQMYAQKN